MAGGYGDIKGRWEIYCREPTLKNRNVLLEESLIYIRYVCRSFAGVSNLLDIEDLINIACCGLLNFFPRWREKGKTYITQLIYYQTRAELYKAISDVGFPSHIYRKIKHGVASKTDLKYYDDYKKNCSFDNTIHADFNVLKREPSAEDLFFEFSNDEFLTEILSQLSPKYREIIERRFFWNMTFAEIGGILNITKQAVEQHYTKAMQILYQKLKNTQLDLRNL